MSETERPRGIMQHFKITLDTTGEVIASEAQRANGLFAKAIGLIGRASMPSGSALIIPSCKCIHMLFMRFPIDAVFCNHEGEIVEIARNLRPWSTSPYVSKASYVIEFASGVASGLSVGETLRIEPVNPSARERAGN